MMSSIMMTHAPWLWLVLALALMSLEIVIPGVHFLWFGVAAAVVALLAWLGLNGLVWQLVAFGALSIVALYFGRRMAHEAGKADPEAKALNERGQQYVGRRVTLEEAITNGRGRVKVGDTVWTAEGPDMPAGTQVTVKKAHGTVLVVDRA